ncbi:uncharacterized protein LOC131658085 [Vicia villosa]|uniref:uncharacterized protein LOC131658085 n=1 Tax=Vicia villosa TaxID=3911 RepID=UPI00273BB6A3|nr:uncharacterized protein LOC131658085 [Vicia villosa]
MDDFPELYCISSLKKVSVAGMGGWNGGVWRWGDLGISDLVVVEAGLETKLAVLRNRLVAFGGVHNAKDSVFWSLDLVKGYSVSPCYSCYASSRIPYGPPNKFDEALELIWRLEIPFKIKAFAWRLFVNRLPTKDLLVYRGWRP